MITVSLKLCKGCKKEKPIEAFSRSNYSKDRLQYFCKECKALIQRKYRQIHKEKVQEINLKSDLKRKYALTVEEYQTLLVKQDGYCAMCYERKPLVIDHCHKTKKVRGLLCVGCNVAVGHYENHKEKIERYLGSI